MGKNREQPPRSPLLTTGLPKSWKSEDNSPSLWSPPRSVPRQPRGSHQTEGVWKAETPLPLPPSGAPHFPDPFAGATLSSEGVTSAFTSHLSSIHPSWVRPRCGTRCQLRGSDTGRERRGMGRQQRGPVRLHRTCLELTVRERKTSCLLGARVNIF